MRTWKLLFGKEMLENFRNYKWLWIPLVFAMLGLMNPVSAYYMPQILQAGGVSAEAAKLIPVPTAGEIMAKALSQFGTLGLLVLVLSFMGTVSSERQSGAAIMVLVKPVSHFQYVASKWAAINVVTLAAFGLGHFCTWLYTALLFETVPFDAVWKSFLLYVLWLVFVNTMTLLFSCLSKSPGGTAFLTLAAAALLSLVAGLLNRQMQWSPSRIAAEAGKLLSQGHTGDGLGLAASITAGLIALLLWGAVAASERMWVRT